MKKILTFIFTILSAFVVFALTLSLKTSADTTSGIAMVESAQVRTAEDANAKQGIKFTGTVTSLPEGSTHGFLVAKGEYSAAQMLEMHEAGTLQEGSEKTVVSDFAVTGTNTTFSLVLYGVPESDYLQDITVLSYVKLADETVESAEVSVTRNLAEVAIHNANGELANNSLINEVVTALNDEYKVQVTDANGNLCYVSLNTNDLAVLEALFVADVNEFVGEEILTTSSTTYDWYWNFTSDSKNDLSEARPYLFFNDETYGAKWRWILEWMHNEVANEEGQAYQDALNAARQIEAILNQTPVYDSNVHAGVGGLNLGRHVVNAVYNFFNSAAEDYGGYPTYHFNTIDSVAGYEDYNNVAYWELKEAVEVGTEVSIPSVELKDGYTSKWTLNGEDFAGETYTVSTEDAKFVPEYSVVTYRVRLFNGETELTDLEGSYTIETSYTLPLVLEGEVLEGWYDNADFEGDPVTEIAIGNTGNKEFYAKVADRVATYVVDQTLTEENNVVTVNGVDFTLGTDAFTSITDALAVAAEGESIYLVAGTYTESFTISTNNVKILGPNFSKSGTATDRAEEAVLTGVITLGNSGEGREFYGLKFSGDAQIASSTYQHYFKFINNVVESTLASGSFISTPKSATYSLNPTIDNNKVTGNSDNTSDFIVLGDCQDLVFTNNSFYNIGGTVLHTLDAARGVVESMNINNNTFDTIGGVVININWWGVLAQSTWNTHTNFSICDNTFLNTTAVNISFNDGGQGANNSTIINSFTITGNQWSVDKASSLVLNTNFKAACIKTINVQED